MKVEWRDSHSRILAINGHRVRQRSVSSYGSRWTEGRPCGIVFHYAAGCLSDLSGVFTQRRVSAHFSVALDGTIYQYVPLDAMAWHADRANQYYVGIEHSALPGRCDLTDQQLRASAMLAAAIIQWAKRNRGVEIPLRKIPGPDLVAGFHDHSDGDGRLWNFNRHVDRLYRWTWDRYLAEVARHLGLTYLWRHREYSLRDLLRAMRGHLSRMRPGQRLVLRVRAKR